MLGACLVFLAAVALSLPGSTGPSAWKITGASRGAVDSQSTRKRPSTPAQFARDDRERSCLGWSQRWVRGLANVLAWRWCSFQNLGLSLVVRVRLWPGNESEVRRCRWLELRASVLGTWWTWDSLSHPRYVSSFRLGNGRPPQPRSLVMIAREAVSAGVSVGVGAWLTFWSGGGVAFRT